MFFKKKFGVLYNKIVYQLFPHLPQPNYYPPAPGCIPHKQKKLNMNISCSSLLPEINILFSFFAKSLWYINLPSQKQMNILKVEPEIKLIEVQHT